MTRLRVMLLGLALGAVGVLGCGARSELHTRPGTASHVIASADADHDASTLVPENLPGDEGESHQIDENANDPRAVGTAVSLLGLAVTLGATVAPYLLF
jgi:hypothetical protein